MKRLLLLTLILLRGCHPAPAANLPFAFPFTPDAVSTNLFPGQELVTDPFMGQVHLVCDPHTNDTVTTGIIVHYGNQSRGYRASQTWPLTNDFIVSNLSSRLPWFFALTACYTSTIPQCTNCFTNAAGIHCVTNYVIESALSDEVAFISSNTLPHLSISNQIVTVLGYGRAGTYYAIWSGSDPARTTNHVFEAHGTNGPWIYTEPWQPAARFFKTETQPAD